jgi:predicted regulator of Ras-like GTPase activity (Roadblock/LC7/MglB family)
LSVDQALSELLRISVEITHVAILDENGDVLGSTVPAASVGDVGGRLWQTTTHIAAAYGEAKLDQLVVDAQGGAVFAVGDGTHVIVALADHRPAVGLIFYDLRACLADAFATEQSA